MLFLFPYFLLWIGFDILLLLVTLYALKKERHRFMWPLVIVTGLKFFTWMIITVFQFIIGIFSTDYFLKFYGQGHHEDFWTRIAIVVLIKAIVLLIGVILFWKLSVFHVTLKYFEAKTDGEIVMTNPEDATGLQKLMQPV